MNDKPMKRKPGSICRQYGHLILLAAIVLLSFGLNFYAISKTGYGNAYYAAAIKSMSQSFKNFFYVSFDPAGVVSVDKPPLGLWIQVLFVKIFGYHGWAMLLPQALAGTASCVMMYILTAKYFGRRAGLISALVFALTPAVVVAARNNTIDSQLVFFLLVAVWFLFKAIEKSKWRYLFLCALFVGLGFNIKMLQAYLILPAVAIVYLIFAKEKTMKRILAGLLSVLIVFVISFAWVFAVDLTPTGSRPYVGSSTDNTELELVIGHNGLERLYGQTMGGIGGSGKNAGGQMPGGGFGGHGGGTQADGQDGNTNGTPPAMSNQNGNNQNNTNTNTNTNNNNTPPAMLNQNGGSQNNNNTNGTSPAMSNPNGGAPGAGGQVNQSDDSDGQNGGFGGQNGRQGGFSGQSGSQGGVAGNDIGSAGLLRLWSSGNYGQVAWLLVFTLFCIAVKIRRFDRKNLQLKQAVFVFWALWLITMFAFFSFAGFWHRYYLCMFAPAIAGLAGPGLIEMTQAFRDKRSWKQILLPLSLTATYIIEFIYVWSYTTLRVWLIPVMTAAFLASIILMAVHYFKPKRLMLLAATGCMLISMLAAPFYWCVTVVMYPPQNVTMPYAGPELASTASVPGMTANQETLTTGDSGTLALEKYLVAHYKEGSYLVVSQRADDVAQFIVDTGLPAVAYGGFLGTDSAMPLDELKELVAEGKVTYFLISSQSGGNSNSDLTSYVKENATLISSSEYSVSSSSGGSTQQTDGRSQETDNGVSGSSLYLFS